MQQHLADYGDPEIDTRIAQYEMAFRMQTSVPDLVDFSNESKATIDRYGPDVLEKEPTPTTAWSHGDCSNAACASCS